MILPIYLTPNNVLRDTSKPISNEHLTSDEFQKYLDDMIETMLNAEGIGLAGAQVGNLIRVTVIDKQIIEGIGLDEFRENKSNPNREKKGYPIINPIFQKKSFKKNIMEEGCLSIPGIYGPVKRPENITIKYLNRSGQSTTLKTDGLLARVIQHEMDHMDGILFTDLTKDLTENKEMSANYPIIS